MSRQEQRHIKSIVAANILAARTEAGLTQRELATKLDLDGVAVSRWERAKVMPSSSSLVALAQALSRDVAWFYTDHEPERTAA